MGAGGRRFGRIYSRQSVIRSIPGPRRGLLSFAGEGRGGAGGGGGGGGERDPFLGRLME